MKIENLTVRFGDKLIFNDFSFDFGDNGVYLIEGVSGKGKTTLFNAIAGLLKFESGNIDLEGKRISYMFQEDRLFPTFTVLENVAAVTGGTDSELKRCEEILCRLDLQDELNSYPSQLSGGMQRRVALARALAYDADILLLDEAFKGLDEKTCQNAIDLVLEYAQNKLVILAAHMIDKKMFGNCTVIVI